MVCVPPVWLTPLQHRRQGLSLTPTQVSDEDDTDPHIRAKVYIRYALQEESSGIGTAHAEQMIAWPKHGYVSRLHRTFLHALARAATP
jgi:hypothetical protein